MSRRRRPSLCLTGALLATFACILPAAAQSPLEVWTAVSVKGVVEAAAVDAGLELAIRSDATSRIVPQITAGAPADVLVTADRAWMLEAVQQGLVARGDARLIGLNRIALIRTTASSQSSSRPSAELTPSELRRHFTGTTGPVLAVAGPSVPAGRYAREALAAMGLSGELEGRLVTVGSARAVVNTVLTGEVSWGIGYRSDALADPAVQLAGIFPGTSHAPAEIWAAPLVDAPVSARAFVNRLAADAFVPSLTALGFDPPLQPTALTAAAASVTSAAPPAQAVFSEAVPAIGPILVRTLVVGLLSVLLATLPALFVGRWLARSRSRAKGPLGTLLLLPLVLPPVVTGFVLLALLGSSGVFGGLLSALGLRLSFTLGAAVIAAAVVGFPLYAVVVRNAFEAVDPRYEELAWTLGAPPRSTFRRVALPLALPGVAAGAVLALARGLGEFGATVVVAGNIEGRTQTLALAVYQLLESPDGRGRIWVFVLASVLIAAVGLGVWEWLGARHRARLLDGGRR